MLSKIAMELIQWRQKRLQGYRLKEILLSQFIVYLAKRLAVLLRFGSKSIATFLLSSLLLWIPQYSLATIEMNALDSAIFFRDSNDFEKALVLFLKAEKYCSLHQLQLEKARVYHELATLYGMLNQPEKAKQYLVLAVKLRVQYNGDETNLSKSLNNLGIVFEQLGQYPKAIDHYTQSAKIKARMGNKIGQANTYNNIAECYEYQKQRDSTIHYYLKSLVIFQSENVPSAIAVVSSNIAYKFFEIGKNSEAVPYYHLSLPLAIEHKDIRLQRKVRLYLSKSFEKLNQPDSALLHYQFYSNLNDSILRLEAIDKIVEIESRHELAQLKKENLEKALRDRQTKIWIGILAFLILAGSVFIILWQRNRILLAKSNQQLTEAKSASFEKAIFLAKIKASVIADEIFHAVNGNLVTIRMIYGAGSKEEGDEAIRETIDNLFEMAAQLRSELPDEDDYPIDEQFKNDGLKNTEQSAYSQQNTNDFGEKESSTH